MFSVYGKLSFAVNMKALEKIETEKLNKKAKVGFIFW